MKSRIVLLISIVSLVGLAALAQYQSVDTVLNVGLAEPYGVAVDANNIYYVTDSANNRIVRIAPDTGSATNFAGVSGPLGRGYVDGPGYQARFFNPQGIVVARGGLVIADSGNHLLRLVAPNQTVSTLAGSTQGLKDDVGTSAQFNSPAGLAVDAAGNIYIADLANNSIRRLAPNNAVTNIASGFRRPAAVAVDENGRIYVADSGNHSIQMVVVTATNTTVTLLAGSGSPFVSGSNDSAIAAQARFNNPQGLLWVGGNTGLLVSDSGNRVVRRVFWNAAVTNYSVETLAITIGAGFANPMGLARDDNGDILVADLGANSIRRLVGTPTQRPVNEPVIGTVSLVANELGGYTTLISKVTSSIFNNDVVVAILGEPGTETFYTTDGTEPSSSNGATPPPYQNGMSSLPTSIIDTSRPNSPPDITIKAFGTAAGRKPSTVVTARFQYAVANPAVIGNNPGSVALECATLNAFIRYTTDGSDPTETSAIYALGSRLNIVNGTNDVTLKVRAYRNGYSPSRVVSQTFVFQNLQTSSIGIVRDYQGGIGATIIVPVEVKLKSDDLLKSLQFRVEIKPETGAPLISDQLRVLAIDAADDFIPVAPPSTNMPSSFVYVTNNATGLLIGYFGTNSALNVEGDAAVAMLAVPIPPTATGGQKYTISVIRPSGTSDGFDTPVPLEPLANRTILVTNVAYIMGDTARANWYNAGEFGSGNLNNNDVNNAFYASLGVRVPYSFSDVFNAMDVYPEDTTGVVGGDNQIRFLDWQVILRRSLLLDTANWKRAWSPGGTLTVATATLNTSPLLPATEQAAGAVISSQWHREAVLRGGYLENVEPGQTVSVPVSLKVDPGYDVSGLQFKANVVPEDGAPPLVSPIEFAPAEGVPWPFASISGPGFVGCGWIVGTIKPALVNDALVGYVKFAVPPTAQKGQSYTVRFLFVDGSTFKSDGKYADYNFESLPGSVWVQGPMLKSPDVITDEWRMRFFGCLNGIVAQALADPDGDGKNNLQEFLAGTNPAKLRFHLLNSEWRSRLDKFHLKWFGVPGKKYVVECAADPITGPWQLVSEVLTGQGDVLNVDAPKVDAKALFYRVRLAP